MVVQGEDDDFETCYTKAQSWIQTIHDRLQTCDKVQGSKEILEARLKETKEILAKEPEGSMWIHKVQVKADLLLDHTSEAKKHEIHQALREIKTTWEDTQTNMVHCHSRIEWVLLHWFEYLKAREDYFSWLVNMKRMLESDLELQLTLKEKKFQLSHHQTLLSSIFNQAALLERLFQESGSLFATTADETLNEKSQQELKASHEDLEQKAKQKVTVLEEIVQDHQLYLDSLEKFQNWLQLMTEKYSSCISHKNCKDHVDGSLQELMELSDSISSKEGELENLKSQAEAVIKNTSPKGAEDINRDLEQLRTDWEDLQRKCERHQAPLQRALQNVLEHQTKTQLLERELAEILDQLQTLELEPPDENEPEIVWRNCLITRSSILAVESQVEELQMKLKNLGMFSQNDTLSAQVLNVIQEFNRVKGKIMRRCSQLVENLRQGFQELLKEFKQWKNNTRNLLDSALDTNDEAFTSLYLQRIEDQLTCSSELQVKLDRFRVLEGMLTKVFNSEQAAAFGAELREASWQQEFFTDLLIKRRGQIQANNQGLANYKLLMKKFEDWLKGEDQKLTNILAANNARNGRERKRRRQVLKVLNCHVPHGQKIFEELIGVECARVNEEEKQLEDLRYRWILYKTKLSEAGDLLSQGQDEVEEFRKPSGGICRYLSRACCAALPLQLLLLFLLLLAFLLPLIEEQDSCSVVNNFARSFYLMLRYQGPPPT
ncbi:nesprin-3 isoform X1 [Mobula birostris]|uniref:nesprin-3 isoform X1 n=2 Tax=Mobula birostris TaxID=1983395 RepID=UPI003B2838A5